MDQYRRDVQIGLGDSASAAFNRIRNQLFTYDIFPPWLVHHAFCPPGALSEGTTIVLRVVMGPIALEMAVRVVEVWNREHDSVREAGFRYVTLQGHTERGVARFEVRQDEEQRVVVLVEARSRPGTLLTRVGHPVTRMFQQAITMAALHRLASA